MFLYEKKEKKRNELNRTNRKMNEKGLICKLKLFTGVH